MLNNALPEDESEWKNLMVVFATSAMLEKIHWKISPILIIVEK